MSDAAVRFMVSPQARPGADVRRRLLAQLGDGVARRIDALALTGEAVADMIGARHNSRLRA